MKSKAGFFSWLTCFWKQRVEAPGEQDTKHNILLHDFDIYIYIYKVGPTSYKRSYNSYK